MKVIYEPKGKAREYSALACNLYSGCIHACKYCYCPAIRFQSLEQWSKNPKARTEILENLEKDLKKLTAEQKEQELLFCFMSDPYQNDDASILTRQALLLCEEHNMKTVNVLTKAGLRAANDFDVIKRNNWRFGSTIIFRDESLRQEWEPGATSIESRYEAVKIAQKEGIFTWVSVEPVVDPVEALRVISDLKPYVTKWKVGKLNHNKKIEDTIDWRKFYYNAKELLADSNVYFKKDLLKFA